MLLLSLVVKCSCEILYIVPATSTQRCGAEICNTLDQITDIIANQNFSNLTLYFLPGQHYLSNDITINHIETVKVIGSSLHTEIWLQQNSLTIDSVKYVTIENLTIASSYSEWFGKVQISQSEDLVTKRCTFRKIRIPMSSRNATITECVFDNTRFFFNCTCVGNGSKNSLNITDSEFLNNKVSTTLEVKGAQLSILRSNFTNNHGGDYGGALKINADKLTLVYISGCEFTANYATHRGGAVCLKDTGVVYIYSTTFSRNTAEEGGAISNNYFMHTGRYTEIVNCTFTQNYDTKSVVDVHTKYLYIINCKFVDDYGELTNKFTTVKVYYFTQAFINNSIMVNNQGKNGGGITFMYGNYVYVTNCKFIDNQAKSYGGAIYSIQVDSIIFFGSDFISNSAVEGGAINIENYKHFELVSCKFSKKLCFE